MMLTLDATDRGGSLALSDGERLLELCYEDSHRTHTDRVMPVVMEMLDKQEQTPEDLDEIVVATGPGSFTAVRLAVTTAKTLAMVSEARLFGISTLRAQAEFLRHHPGRIRSVIDARRGQVYLQDFERDVDGELQPLSDPQTRDRDLLLEGLTQEMNPRLVARSRTESLSPPDDLFPAETELLTRPLALALSSIGLRRIDQSWPDTDGLAPLYVREPDARRSRTTEQT